LLRGVLEHKISPHTAACEVSYCRRPEPTGRGSENRSKAIAWAMFRLFHPKPLKKAPAQASGAEFSNKEELPNVSAPAKT
jgi:hypothetical protein